MIFKTGEQDKYDMIFPRPAREEYKDAYYTLKEKYELGDLLEFYRSNKNGTSDIAIKNITGAERDEYMIKADENGITLSASDDEGYFRAFTSLRQLMLRDHGRVMFCDIHDKPQFVQRGFMLDISRCRKPKPEYIRTIIDILAGLKYNEFQLYMEDFCFKYSAYPQFTEGFDCLTPEDIKAIEGYCEDRFIELVPNQNGFGHMTSWLATDELKHLAVTEDTIDPLDPESLEVMDKIYGSLLPYFKSGRVHIGLDEATGLGKNQTEAACRERGKAAVFMEWLNKLSDLCEKKYGKSVMFWGDMIINNPECFSQMPENAIPVEWDYEDISAQLVDRRCRELAKTGHRFYVAPATTTWRSFTGRFETSEFNIRYMAELGQEHGAYGYLLTDWGDGGHPQNTVWSYVQIALAAQYSWNVGIKQHGGWRKPYFLHGAQDYMDEYVFGAKISRLLCDMGNYYTLEPEHIAVSTIVFNTVDMPLDENIKEDFYDITRIGDPCSFEDIICRMKRDLAKVEALELDELYKREIAVNVNMVILGAELAIGKMNGGVTKQKAEELHRLIDDIMKEHREVWLARNYEKGIETFLGVLKSRQDELAGFIKK